MSQHDENLDVLEENQDHIIQCLQDHETRLSRNEEHIRKLDDQIKKMQNVIIGNVKQSLIFAEATTIAIMARVLSDHVRKIQRGLYQLSLNKLDPSLVRFSAARDSVKKITELAATKGYTIGIAAAIDIFQVETSFLSDGTNIYVFTNIPLVRNNAVIDIFRYQSAPLNLINEKTQVIIKPEEDIIAISNDRATYETFKQSHLNACKKLHDSYICDGRSIQKKQSHKQCLYALYMKSQNAIVENCEMITKAPEEFVVQTGIGKFYLYSPISQRIYANCDDSKQTLELQGFKTLSLPEGCTVTTNNHVIQTSSKQLIGYDVEVETMELKLENLIDDSTIDKDQLFGIVSKSMDEGEKLTITDIKKKYKLEKLDRSHKKNAIWIYSVVGTISLLIIAFALWQIRKKKFNKPPVSGAVRFERNAKPRRRVQKHDSCTTLEGSESVASMIGAVNTTIAKIDSLS